MLAVAAFLSPLLRTVSYSLKSIDQITQAHSPLYPADPVTFAHEGEELAVMNVPMPDGTTRQLGAARAASTQSTFIDPADPTAEPIVWQGSWRTLEPVWQFAPHWENFGEVWRLIDYPRLLFNTIVIAIISTIGTVLSCTIVAYGFAVPVPRPEPPVHAADRHDLPAGGGHDHPDVHDLPEDRLGRDRLPLLVPAFFANAFDVFLMRQYFMTIPMDLDEAAAIDGPDRSRR